MDEQKIKKILAKIEEWMMMTCEGCALPEKLNPLLGQIKQIIDSENKPDKREG
ncbi:MAG: hypothetical protein H5T98_08960 [Syntrophomonadaceae bacterium]|nr:hypothetical protein [Syntrophomonadaceae bacterium]